MNIHESPLIGAKSLSKPNDTPQSLARQYSDNAMTTCEMETLLVLLDYWPFVRGIHRSPTDFLFYFIFLL